MDETLKKSHKVLILVGVAVIVALLFTLALSGGNLQLLKSLFVKNLSDEELSRQLMEFGWRGYVVIGALATLQVVCTFLPAEPVQVLGGFTFGFPIGLLCCMLGVVLGNSLIFLLQKTFGNRLRGFFVKKLNLDLNQISRSSKATLIIFILYFLPAIPYGMICFFAASMGMSYRRYITVTVLGSLPSVCIGVGLGYMTIASDSTLTLCVFGALIAIVLVMIWKREALFARLNRFAEKHKKTHKNAVREANGLLLNLLYGCVRVFMFCKGVKIRAESKVSRVEKNSLILVNHGSFIDFIYAIVLLRRYKPHFMVARLYFYHKLLGGLIRSLGAFPKSMFATDIENAKNSLTVLKNGGMLAMMPEARLSTAGRFEDIQESTYAFIKKCGVTVYTVKLSGAYLADPKWGKGFRRGALVEAQLDILFTPEQLKELSIEQLQQAVDARLAYDEYAWLQTRPKLRYRSRRMAEGLENILAVCPVCGRKHCLTTRKDRIFCQHCGELTGLNDRYGFTGDFRFENPAQWYDWQTGLLQEQIRQDPQYRLSSQVELRLPGEGNALTRHAGYGCCTLSREGLTYEGTMDGETVCLHYPLRRIYRLLFGAGVNFEIYDGAQIRFFVPEEKRSAVDWYMTSRILYDLEVRESK